MNCGLPMQASYSLSESEYAAAGGEGSGGWARRLLAGLEGVLAWLQPLLTTGNYEVSMGRRAAGGAMV